MKTTSKIIAAIAATAALALAGAASGHPGSGPGMGMGHGKGMGMGMGMGPEGGPMAGPGMMGWSGGDTAAHLSALRARLKITPAQESAWKAYENAVTQQASARQAAHEKFRAQWQDAKPGEVPDMAAHVQEMAALRQSGSQAQKARVDLFAVLTPDQLALVGGGWGPRGGPAR